MILMGLIFYIINIFFLTREMLVNFQTLNLYLKVPVSSSETSLRNTFDFKPAKWNRVLQDMACIALYSSSRNRTDCFAILFLMIFKHRCQRLQTKSQHPESHIFKSICFPTFSIWITLLKNNNCTVHSFRNSKIKHTNTLVTTRRHSHTQKKITYR